MSLLCGKNSALEGLNSIRDQIKAQLASKKGALGGLSAAADAIKSKIAAVKAAVPSLDSFQAELAALTGATPAQIAAFKAKWDGKVADLNSLVAKVTSGIANAIDICKDVPNVKMNPTTGAVVEEAKESKTPNTAPAEAPAVTPTVVVKSKETSSGISGVVPETTLSKFETAVQTPFQEQVRGPLSKDAYAKSVAEVEARNSRDYFSAVQRQSRYVNNDEARANSTAAELAALDAMAQATLARRAADTVRNTLDRYFTFRVEKGDESAAEFWNKVKESGNTSLGLVDNSIIGSMQDVRPWMLKVDAIIDANTDVVTDYYKYKHNVS